MKEKIPKSWRYHPKEREKMLKAGFPLCLSNHHCGSCIKHYRERINREKTK